MPVFIVGTRYNCSRPVASISDQAQLLRRSSGLCGGQVNRGAYATTCPLMESRALDLQVPSTGAFRTEDVLPAPPLFKRLRDEDIYAPSTSVHPPPSHHLPRDASRVFPRLCATSTRPPAPALPPSPRASAATPSPALTRSNMEQRA